MKRILGALLILVLSCIPNANAFGAVSEADAKYAQAAGKATQDFSAAITDWGATYQAAPDKVSSPKYKSWMKKALAADNAVKASLTQFSKIKVSPGFKKSDVALRKFITAYTNALNLYGPAIKKNDEKLIKKANSALMSATTLFTTWGNEFAKDSSRLAQ